MTIVPQSTFENSNMKYLDLSFNINNIDYIKIHIKYTISYIIGG